MHCLSLGFSTLNYSSKLKRQMRMLTCYLILHQNCISKIIFPCPCQTLYKKDTSENQITINSRDIIYTFSLGGAGFSVIAVVFVARE